MLKRQMMVRYFPWNVKEHFMKKYAHELYIKRHNVVYRRYTYRVVEVVFQNI